MATERVLVTNDDGIDGPGLRVLVAELVRTGFTPIVVAPDSDYSGAGTSLISQSNNDTFSEGGREIGYERRVLDEAPDVEAYALAAPPAMCTLLAMRGAFGERPALVASGINYGLNVGPAVRFSGTVSAAMTASGFGVPAIAVSARFNFEEPDLPIRYDTAATLAAQLLAELPGSQHGVLNLNVPQLGLDDLAGIRSGPVSTVTGFHSYVEDRTEDRLKIAYKVGEEPFEPDSDSGLINAGFAAVTSLVGYSSIDCTDLVTRVNEAAA